jgi:hypothetical protein
LLAGESRETASRGARSGAHLSPGGVLVKQNRAFRRW